jgi:electron transport complex protein RnfA
VTTLGTVLTFTFVNNVVLGQLLGVCPLLGLPRGPRPALRASLALAAAMPAAALLFWAMRRLVLAPLGLQSLELIAFCLVLALPLLLPLRGRLGLLLPSALLNCAVLGVGLLSAGRGYAFPGGSGISALQASSRSAAASLAVGLAAAAGYLLAAVVFAGLRERLDREWAPRAMRGLPLSLLTAGLMALAFMALDRTLLAALTASAPQ